MTRHRLARWVEAVAALVTVVTVAITIVRHESGQLLDAVVLAVALSWGAAGVVAELLSARRTDAPDDPVVGVSRSVTTIVRLGEVPDEIARTTIAVASGAGPVIVLTGDRDVPAGLPSGVPTVAGTAPVDGASGTDGAAGTDDRTDLERALDLVDTHAVLLTSARALPRADACRAAAVHLTDDVGWAIGECRPLNADRFGSDRRERVDAHLRARPGGPWLWEPDATIVRADLLREHPLLPGRPFGAWLRDRARDGVQGVRIDETLSLRAAPVSAAGYWPDTAARQRAAAADLSDATWRRGPSPRARLQGGALLVRALSGWSIVWWLAALVLTGDGLPVEVPPVRYGLLVGLAIVLRWLSLRAAVGVPPSLTRDPLAALYAVPGSIGATGAVFTRRVRPPRVPVPTRPLIWVALAATVVAANGLLTADPGDGSTRVAAVVSVVLLVLLWVFTVRSLVEKNWERTGFRVRLDLAASLRRTGAEAVAGRVVDGSTGGFAFLGPHSGLGPGDELEVRVTLSDGTSVDLAGTVASRRRRSGGELLGVELRAVLADAEDDVLRPVGGGAAAWAAELVDAARDPLPLEHPAPVEARATGRARAATWLDRVVLGVVVATSLLVVVALTLVLIGFRPLVIRSGSMEPAYHPGDLVLVDTVRASTIEVGDVVTRFDAPETYDSLTHRVRAVRVEGDEVSVETRGDANQSSEFWTVPASSEVGRVVAHVPWIGLPATLVRTSTAWMLIGAVVLVVLVALVLRPRGRRRDPTPEKVPSHS